MDLFSTFKLLWSKFTPVPYKFAVLMNRSIRCTNILPGTIDESKNFSPSGVKGGGNVVRSIRSASVKIFFSFFFDNTEVDKSDVVDVSSVGKLSGLWSPKLKSLPSKLNKLQMKVRYNFTLRSILEGTQTNFKFPSRCMNWNGVG